MDVFNNHSRIYPSQKELTILLNNMKIYFSFPERSKYRNEVTKKTSEVLSVYSKQWTQRKVRQWFNNNKSQNGPHKNGTIASSEDNINSFIEKKEFEYITNEKMV